MMKVLLNMMIVCGLVSLADYTATAQTRVSTCPPVEKPTLHVSQVGALTGCPFSAVIQNTHSQTLADGTHVQTKSKTVVYRDSLGRIRVDSYAPTDSVPSMILISDPAAGFSYMLLPQKICHSLPSQVKRSRSGTKSRCARSTRICSGRCFPARAARTETHRRETGVSANGRSLGHGKANYNDDSCGRRRQRPRSHDCVGELDFLRHGHHASGKNFRPAFWRLRKANDEFGAGRT